MALGNKMLAVVVLRGRSKSVLRFAAQSRTLKEAAKIISDTVRGGPTKRLKRQRLRTLPIRHRCCRRCQNTLLADSLALPPAITVADRLKDAKPLETVWQRADRLRREQATREAELLRN